MCKVPAGRSAGRSAKRLRCAIYCKTFGVTEADYLLILLDISPTVKTRRKEEAPAALKHDEAHSHSNPTGSVRFFGKPQHFE